jgi:quinoprotein glucose dehydrogenase
VIHRRHDAGESAAGPAGDVARVGHAHRQAGLDVPLDPGAGEKHNDTWAGDSWKNRSGVNVLGLHRRRRRARDRLHAVRRAVGRSVRRRSRGRQPLRHELVGADANTGKYLWHFQVVHHDIWDSDLSAAPALIDVKQGGKTIPAVAVINKPGLLFLLDRVTGKPIYGVEERPVPRAKCRSSARRRRSLSRQARAALAD